MKNLTRRIPTVSSSSSSSSSTTTTTTTQRRMTIRTKKTRSTTRRRRIVVVVVVIVIVIFVVVVVVVLPLLLYNNSNHRNSSGGILGSIIWMYQHMECYGRELGIQYVEGPTHYIPLLSAEEEEEETTTRSHNNNDNNSTTMFLLRRRKQKQEQQEQQPLIQYRRSCPKITSYYTTTTIIDEEDSITTTTTTTTTTTEREQQQQQEAVHHLPHYSSSIQPHQICLTTLTDNNNNNMNMNKNTHTNQQQSTSFSSLLPQHHRQHHQRRCRDFDNVGLLTYPNHVSYAKKHGYTIIDSSDILDKSRPPAWSKILAVQRLFGYNYYNNNNNSNTSSTNTNNNNNANDSTGSSHNHSHNYDCEWVMWLDADVVIMNSNIKIESFLPIDFKPTITTTNTNRTTTIPYFTPHLLVTYDRKYIANSGVWLMKKSIWSQQFLYNWWNSMDYIRPFGLSLSGDNEAFGHLVQQQLQQQQQESEQYNNRHYYDNNVFYIAMVPRCTFNSFGVFITKQELQTYYQYPTIMKQQKWYHHHDHNNNHNHNDESDQYYYDGDFIAHASGIDQKYHAIQLLLKHAH